ncbi:hypothetical protein CIPAW_08G087600 [Carya illinoinensis]|uniref:WRKY domain-containing protein n=1 Tax=Carya illinoinensis TaxID=32201 RepID=A0A8T1PU50_CARIL|nr:hypothetical protein CIPAW_08G087600 [Carya illinoinensis]KAG6644952.1 hypothetical protein CIPAW_08G087600 [Carya illinoinensis]
MASSAPLPVTTVKEGSEVLNQPATPNSSSISSASSEAVNDEQTKAVDQEEQQEKTKKQLKPKKTNQKRQREPRFAFVTKSEVDQLEDGYRWRKYGQKAVKNSPFPRSYYRCTTASCNVKKRVERSFTDPSTVVTTYEGQHTHPSPVIPRQSLTGAPPGAGISVGCATNFAMPMSRISNLSQYQQQRQQSFIMNTSLSPSTYDKGLLQDIVPSHMLKEE